MKNLGLGKLVVGALALSALSVGCVGSNDGDSGGKTTPTPTADPSGTPTPAPQAGGWASASLTFDGLNNPNTNFLCASGGDQNFNPWTGGAEVTTDDGTKVQVGFQGGQNLAAAECIGSAGGCLAAGDTADQCLFLFYNEGQNTAGNLQINLLWVFVAQAGTNWNTTGPVTLGTPTQAGDTSFAYGRVMTDGDGNGDLSSDANGNIIAPDTDEIVGVTENGGTSALTLAAAGKMDGEAVKIQGTAAVKFAKLPTARAGAGADPAISPDVMARMERLQNAVLKLRGVTK